MHAPVDCEMPPGTIGENALKLKSELWGRGFAEEQDRCDKSEERGHKEILEAGSMVDRRQLGMTRSLDNLTPREFPITVKQELSNTPRARYLTIIAQRYWGSSPLSRQKYLCVVVRTSHPDVWGVLCVGTGWVAACLLCTRNTRCGL